MKPIDFIHELSWQYIPNDVQRQVKRCLLDTIGTAIAGRKTRLSQIIYEFVCDVFGGQGAILWLDGREVSPVGAALAHGMTIDALDIHDNFNQAKGHAGVAIVPAALGALGFNKTSENSGQELLTAITVGYEIALRAGVALHATACDYHTSGAWNALGCAAVVARRLHLSREKTHHALGIAEYHGPRSQMMRCIEYPTMLKDGSGWGAMAGVSAALLAHKDFTGAPAITVESPEVSEIWTSIGASWYIMEQDFKRYPVCHWAQPPITGTIDLMNSHRIMLEDIQSIQVFTFHEATRLSRRHPTTTEQAQYSLSFPLAAAVICGDLGLDEVSGEALTNQRILELTNRIEIFEDEYCNNQFPEQQLARVKISTHDGCIYKSGIVESPWDQSAIRQPHQPPDQELRDKFHRLVSDALSEARAMALEEKMLHCDHIPDANSLIELLT